MNQTPPKLIYLVVISLAGLAFIGVSSLCGTLFYKNYADPAVLTSIIAITSGTVGALGGILSSPRSAVTQTTTSTDSKGATTVTTQPVMLAPVPTTSPSPDPTPVVVKNEPDEPVPTKEGT